MTMWNSFFPCIANPEEVPSNGFGLDWAGQLTVTFQFVDGEVMCSLLVQLIDIRRKLMKLHARIFLDKPFTFHFLGVL